MMGMNQIQQNQQSKIFQSNQTNNNITNLEKKLNEQILKNKKLENENIQLINENKKLKSDIENLNRLNQSNQLYMQNNQNNIYEINRLKNELLLKEKELNKIKVKLNETEKKYNMKDIMVINFNSNNLCMSGGQVILRFKTIGENNLKNGTVVTIDSHDE